MTAARVLTVADMAARNKAAGQCWFDRSSMRFFGTRFESRARLDRAGNRAIFVTSEQPPHGPRKYSVRAFNLATADVDTVGEFCGYRWRDDALAAARAERFLSR